MSSKIPKQYVPDTLTPAQKKKQIKSIREKKDRPKLKNVETKRSVHVVKFEKRYGKKITDDAWISKNLLRRAGIKQIISKGMGAYYSSGSRPNTTPQQWARARLASALTGGGASKTDKAILEKYKVKK
tara:strand:- start:883 stop:1266 length:384 start_codon:yes stop_codon:yes gene_type:complete